MADTWLNLYDHLENVNGPFHYAIFKNAVQDASKRTSIQASLQLGAYQYALAEAATETANAALYKRCFKPSNRMWTSAQKYVTNLEQLAAHGACYEPAGYQEGFEDHETVSEEDADDDDFIDSKRFGVPIARVSCGQWSTTEDYQGQLIGSLNMRDMRLEVALLKWHPDSTWFEVRLQTAAY